MKSFPDPILFILEILKTPPDTGQPSLSVHVTHTNPMITSDILTTIEERGTIGLHIDMGSTLNVDCEVNTEARYRLFRNRIGVASEVQVYIHVWG